MCIKLDISDRPFDFYGVGAGRCYRKEFQDRICLKKNRQDEGKCINTPLRKRLCIWSEISVNYHYLTVLCPFNVLIRFKCYNTVQKQILTNINKYILHVSSIKLRDKLYFSFSISTPGFPNFYYMLGANLGLLLYREVSVMLCKKAKWKDGIAQPKQIQVRKHLPAYLPHLKIKCSVPYSGLPCCINYHGYRVLLATCFMNARICLHNWILLGIKHENERKGN